MIYIYILYTHIYIPIIARIPLIHSILHLDKCCSDKLYYNTYNNNYYDTYLNYRGPEIITIHVKLMELSINSSSPPACALYIINVAVKYVEFVYGGRGLMYKGGQLIGMSAWNYQLRNEQRVPTTSIQSYIFNFKRYYIDTMDDEKTRKIA